MAVSRRRWVNPDSARLKSDTIATKAGEGGLTVTLQLLNSSTVPSEACRRSSLCWTRLKSSRNTIRRGTDTFSNQQATVMLVCYPRWLNNGVPFGARRGPLGSNQGRFKEVVAGISGPVRSSHPGLNRGTRTVPRIREHSLLTVSPPTQAPTTTNRICWHGDGPYSMIRADIQKLATENIFFST
jgi:hypothetical protein